MSIDHRVRPVPSLHLHNYPHTVSLEDHLMLLYEALARSRVRNAEEAARRLRLARRVVAARRWQRLARYASARAERARRAV
ncbi:MAG TPA: hypothetical protein VGH99_12325 [Pseudonocardia sp.]|jgi:hypothetical protein